MKKDNSVTQINESILRSTQIEINLDGYRSNNNVTSINPELVQTISDKVAIGTVINSKYKIVSNLNIGMEPFGEAELFVCSYENKEYVIKMYKRTIAIKDEVIKALQQIDSPYVSKIFDTGIYEGKPYDILPYYKKGSLQGKTFSLERLKRDIIPCINEGLKLLHSVGIIHKDLKPSNIMLCDNEKDVAIIDFGVSSVKKDGNTVILTETGKTPDYSAPETFRNLYLDVSDYYSFGITLMELFCGYTPYKNMKQEDFEKYVAIQKTPIPKMVPEELSELIAALTYYDITNRKEKSNPNRRWTYEEVEKWCKGEKLVLPGTQGGIAGTTQMPAYPFMNQQFTDIPSLMAVLATNWEMGKKQLFRGMISNFFKSFNPDLANICLSAELEATKTNGKDDIIFWKTLYSINPELKTFYWKGTSYESLSALGRDMLERLWKNDESQYEYYDNILTEKLLSTYVELIDPNNKDFKIGIESIEAKYKLDNSDNRNKVMTYYLMGYMLSGQKILDISGVQFSTVGEFATHVKELVSVEYEEFESFCHQLIDYDNNLDVRLESWLIAIGKRNEIEKWRKTLND